MDVKAFVSRLELCCKEKGLTRTSFAKDFGIPESTIRNWIRNGNMPSAEIVYNMSKYFNVPMEYLIGGKESPLGDAEIIMFLKMQKLSATQKKMLITVADSLIKQDES
ncbi:MAG: helix-turn-helix transcriptional regulator [Methanobrevibacter sp.]|nr:helix-turn-helix transcriptional regulator [Methanobrevibacter sp.]